MFGRRQAFLGQVPLALDTSGDQWWNHHIQNTRAYLEAALAHDVPASLAALAQLWSAVLDWQRISNDPTQGLLMGEHTALAKLLIDCYAQGQGSGCVDTATAGLLRNVEAQRALFPKNPTMFADLFKTHVVVTGKYIAALASENIDEFNHLFAAALQNGKDLGAFTDSVF